MDQTTRLDELLLAWQEQADRGNPTPVEELCRDCPDLIPELRRRIAEIDQFTRTADPTHSRTPLSRTQVAPFDAAATMAISSGATVPTRQGIPGYEILGELGRGGMGVVYKARQIGLKRVVALKMVLAGGHARPEQLARFRAEAEAV